MVEIKGIRFDVKIVHKRIKNLYLRLDGKTIVASAPILMPDFAVYRFIDSKRDWIYRAYDRMTYRERTTMKYHGGDVFYLFGEPYRLVRTIGKKNASVSGDRIYLSYGDDSEDGIRYLYKYLDKILLERAEKYLDEYRSFLIDYGYTMRPELKSRVMTSKWGVCFTRKNRITISSYLIHYPLKCLEYIMVHEMTHFIVPNHSKRFYDIVRTNMPDYKKAVEMLKR